MSRINRRNKMKGGALPTSLDDFYDKLKEVVEPDKKFIDFTSEPTNEAAKVAIDGVFKDKYKIFLLYGISFLIFTLKSTKAGPSAIDPAGSAVATDAGNASVLSASVARAAAAAAPATAPAAPVTTTVTTTAINEILQATNVYDIYNKLINMVLIQNLFYLVNVELNISTTQELKNLYSGGAIENYNSDEMKTITNKENNKDIHKNLLIFMNFLLYLHPDMTNGEFLKTFTVILYILSIFIESFTFNDAIKTNLLDSNTKDNTKKAFKLNYVEEIYNTILTDD